MKEKLTMHECEAPLAKLAVGQPRTANHQAEEYAKLQQLVGTGIHPHMSHKNSDYQVKSIASRQKQSSDHPHPSTLNTKGSPIQKTKRSKAHSGEAKSKASNFQKKETPTIKLVDNSKVIDVLQRYEQHSNFLKQLENFPNFANSPREDNEYRSGDHMTDQGRTPIPIKVHVREEKDSSVQKQDLNDNSCHELMTNIRVRSKTTLDACPEEGNGGDAKAGSLLYDLDIDPVSHEEKQENDPVPDNQLQDGQPMTVKIDRPGVFKEIEPIEVDDSGTHTGYQGMLINTIPVPFLYANQPLVFTHNPRF